ncbi:hypothetical protein BD769DRAFT_1486700 [Suillus cothurnatus]|nr:hypothetical protein BD769DRAFT_1486700 [Suillus cothurnatus]
MSWQQPLIRLLSATTLGSSSASFPTQGNQLAVKAPVFPCAHLHLGSCCTCVKSLTSLISFDNAVSRQMLS